MYESRQQKVAPNAEHYLKFIKIQDIRSQGQTILAIFTKQTRNNAIGNGYKNPARIVRNNDPGMANDCKLNCFNN